MWGKETRNRFMWALPLAAWLMVSMGCGGAGSTGSSASGSSSSSSSSGGGSTQAVTTVSVSPASANVRLGGAAQAFAATVTNNATTTVTWMVNGVAGGNSTTGTIDTSGNYRPPAAIPNPNTVTVTATSTADTTKQASATVTLQNPVPTVSAVTPTLIPAGTFTLTVNGTRFVQGAKVMFGGQALPTTYVSASQLTATGTATAQASTVAVTVVNPDPGTVTSADYAVSVISGTPAVSYNAAVRFLEQTTFGPTPSLIAHVQVVGFDAFLNEQFAAPVTTLPFDINTVQNGTVQNFFYSNAIAGQNQLRQRMAFALGQIFVVSGLKITSNSTTPSYNGLAAWQQMLEQDAFDNYAKLLRDATLSPVMGNYLDMANNDKPSNGKNPNENYAREVLQLFSIGLYDLNPDGTLKTDTSGQPINSYDQDVVEGYAHLFTGWTYPLKAGATQQKHNPQYYGGPMVVVETNHDTSAKEILGGVTLPAGQSSSVDLDAGLAAIANHPNVGPFICKQLIQRLVKSNPSAAYVKRVSDVFANNGSGARGDLRAVTRAILLDAEARAGDDGTAATADAGHLREPALYITSVMRALNATTDGTRLVTYGSNMGQNILYPSSVFNYFHPNYVIDGTNMVGPEFELLGPSTAIARANFVADLTLSTISGQAVDYSSWTALAADPNKLMDALNGLFLHGQMSSAMRDAILTAVNAVPSNQPDARAKQALYLVLTSPQYQTQQ